MKKVIDKAESRGRSLYDWLDSYHTFSFDGYYNPRRMNFGALRIIGLLPVAYKAETYFLSVINILFFNRKLFHIE